jgi:predicted SnoaL-like aldol condensation-catalyzing enzyme
MASEILDPAKMKSKIKALLESIETGAKEPAFCVNPQKYVQHNPNVEDGLIGFAKVLSDLPKGSTKARVKRVFCDGDYVFAHTEYNFFGPKIGFDIFRFEEGKIGRRVSADKPANRK